MPWWLVWTVVGGVVLLSLLLVAVPAMGVRRRLAEFHRVRALAQERTAARTRKLLAGWEQVQATLRGVQDRTAVMQREVAALKASRASDRAALEAVAEDPGAGRGADRR